jgi:ectoine hydroxylase-related dioxygenase (phytanoyl-CoA dioxygenase family)
MRAHDLNRDFEWIDRTGPFTRITPQQARDYDELGYFVLDDAFDATEIAAVIAEIDPFEAEVEAFLQATDGGKVFIARANEITFTTHLVTRSSALRAFTEGPVFRDLAADLIGPDVRLYWDQAVYKKPGTDSPFPWHQDNGYAFVEPQQYLTCWIALSDATLDNGCPWVVPGVHRQGTLAHESSDLGFVCLDEAEAASHGAVAVEAKAGSIVVFSSLTPHCTGPNHTSEIRKSYIVQLAPEGASVRSGDGSSGTPADDASRQYPILVGGRPA